MLKIRLQRVGRKHDPSFRVVVTDSRCGPRSGNIVELVGSYNARRGRPAFKTERVKHWIGVGARPSATVHNLLVAQKIVSGPKINVLGPKPVKVDNKPAEPII